MEKSEENEDLSEREALSHAWLTYELWTSVDFFFLINDEYFILGLNP